MVELIEKLIMAKKRITQEILEQYNPKYGKVYVRGHVIDFSPSNIAHYLSYPHFSDIEGASLEEEADFDEVTKCGATFSNSIHTKTYWSKQVYQAAMASPSPLALIVESSEVTTSLDLLNQELSTLLGIEVVLWSNGVEDLKGFMIEQLVPRGALKS
ncbi:hypothetical protein M9H77_13823 [Catharanthus roseus]|uniref:Uncharacterized protein n=1 Tax=Catharanthus roseus TaxID=4058 RepID=A0ACC0BLA7_CATRO|nr:hypothetical protein M9H77_13823 [Catharanthus roseus]